LLTEAEHQRLRQVAAIANEASDLTVPAPYNLNLRWGGESPVDVTGTERRPCDVFGNVWQWLEDHFNPLSGFKIHRFYDDFSTPCFDGEHYLILGGSFVSTGDEATPWARFHFRPHFFQHAGFRVAYSDDGGPGQAVRLTPGAHLGSRYETEGFLDRYLLLHYGKGSDQLPFDLGVSEATEFPRRCVEMIERHCRRLGLPTARALDVGCAVGGATFQLARTFDEVIGVDLSEQFIEAAEEIRLSGELAFRRRDEGDLYTSLAVSIGSDLRDRVRFRRADACSLPAEYVDFDCVLIANVLCRLPSPNALLSRMGGSRGIVRRGGLMLITSPFTWSEEFTPKDVWLGGYEADGRPVHSEDGLTRALAGEFELLERCELPLLISEHRRKYHYIVPLATVWRRR